MMFLACTVIHYCISDYMKQILVLPDDALYYSIANSLWNGQGIAVNNLPYDFQKILYCILIMPAFCITDIVKRISTITFINSIVISSGIFPVYFLAKRYLKNCKNIILSCALYCVCSDLMFATTLLAENLYLPMGLWGIYFSSVMLDQTELLLNQNESKISLIKYYVCSILLGIYFYFLFLCKEVAAVFPLTYLIFVMSLFVQSIIKKTAGTAAKKVLIHVGCMLIGFGTTYLLFRLLVFPNTFGGGYRATESDINQSFDYFYLYYGFVYYLLMVILAYGIFPIIIPIIQRKKLDERERHFNDFLLLLLIITAAVVSFKITVGENWAETTPRIHLRYTCFLFMPIVIMMLNTIEHTSSINRKRIIIPTVVLSVGYMYLCILGDNKLVPKVEIFDQTMLQYLAQNIDYQMIIVCAMCTLFIITSIVLAKKYQTGLLICLATLLCLNVINTVQVADTWHSSTTGNQITVDELNDALQVSDYIKSHSDKNILFLLNHRDYTIDLTYVSEANTYMIDPDYFQKYMTNHLDENLMWPDASDGLKLTGQSAYYDNLSNVDIIIIGDDLLIDIPESDGQLQDEELNNMKVYVMNDSQHVPQFKFTYSIIGGTDSIDQQIDDALKKYQEKQSQTSTAE